MEAGSAGDGAGDGPGATGSGGEAGVPAGGGAGEGGSSGAAELVPYGLTTRLPNPSCFLPSRPTGDGDGFPRTLSETGCVSPDDPARPLAFLIPYAVNAALYSDGADKRRYLALPDGATIRVGTDGDLELPAGSVLLKYFELEGAAVETRLFVRHEDGEWAGYSYAWREDGSDAELLETTVTRWFGEREWTYPSRENCLECHTAAAGRTLGLELGQLNRTFAYEAGVASQLATFEHIGLFEGALPDPPPALPSPHDVEVSVESRARAYLHANCGSCHRPGAVSETNIDLRYATAVPEMNVCNVAPSKGAFGLPDAKLVKPGDIAASILRLRLERSIAGVRMPPLGRSQTDAAGVALIDAWIRGLTGCP